MNSRDLTNVRLVGIFALLAGIMLMLFTLIASLVIVLTASPITINEALFRDLSTGVLALVMALVLIGCGGTMGRLRPGLSADLENLRLIWTALFLMMLICVPFGAWLAPPLADLAILTLAALLLIRGSVIRLTSH